MWILPMSNLRAQALCAIQNHQMLKSGDTVIVGCSGGADSITLFHFLYSNAESLGITLRAVHVNHGLRGEASDADEQFVRSLCEKYCVPLDVARLIPPENPSEDWARRERYKAFEALSRKYHAKIATAHTKNDLAETVLFNISRGAGVHGAAGIPAVRGAYIRPLISSTREDVEAYAAENNLAYVTDATNLTHDYARNRIRLSVLPAFETVHGGAVQAIGRFAQNMSEAAEYFDAKALALLDEARLSGEKNAYATSTLLGADKIIRHCALRLLITPHADATKPRIDLADACVINGGAVQLSSKIIISSKQGILRVQPAAIAKTDWQQPFSLGSFAAPDGSVFTVTTQSYEKIINFEKQCKKHLKFCADYDRITKNTCFRTRRAGDTFCMAGRGVTKKLKDIFTEARLSQQTRVLLPVLAQGSTVLWADGFGFAQSVAANENTKIILTINKVLEEQTWNQ
ncbi:MAG: tRNA lysidine(34) synthetase TilS [Clostridia bacterium]|jgi:tRNA(Ile)-lysidine synthase|nr:tRNA lysidine(34) synthetase TilS [Clostridia bacterium]